MLTAPISPKDHLLSPRDRSIASSRPRPLETHMEQFVDFAENGHLPGLRYLINLGLPVDLVSTATDYTFLGTTTYSMAQLNNFESILEILSQEVLDC